MLAFWDTVKLAGVIVLGLLVMIVGIVLYTLVDTFEALKSIVMGKR